MSGELIHALQWSPGAGSLCILVPKGFVVATTSPTLKRRCARFFDGQQLGKAATFHGSNMVVCTGVSGQDSFSDSMLCVFNESMGRVVFEVKCSEPIARVLVLSRSFVVASKSEIRLYTFDPPILHVQYRTGVSEFSPCDAVEVGEKDFVVAMPGRQPGTLRIVRSEKCECQDVSVSAHTRPITLIKLSGDGSLVATSSTLGTVIKVFDTSTGACVGQCRRGTLAAEITALAFSQENEYLAVSSSKGTVHMFRLKFLKGPDVQVRSDIRIQNPDLGTAALAFAEKNALCAASLSGKFYLFRCSDNGLTAVQERCEPLAEILAK